MSPAIRAALIAGILELAATIASMEDALPTAMAGLRRQAREQIEDLLRQAGGGRTRRPPVRPEERGHA